MVDGTSQLISGRFVVLILHAVATCSLFYGTSALIGIDLDPRDTIEDRERQYEDIDRWMTTLLTLAMLLMSVELIGLCSGHTLHMQNANALSALAHLGGFLSTLSMVLNGWTVRVYTCVFALCSCLPAGFDMLWWTFQGFKLSHRRQ